MSGFAGLKRYQDFRRWDVMQKGYILLSPVTKHKAYIYDFDELQRVMERQKEDDFWDYYWEMKKAAPDCDTVQMVTRFNRRKSESQKQSINYPMEETCVGCKTLLKFGEPCDGNTEPSILVII